MNHHLIFFYYVSKSDFNLVSWYSEQRFNSSAYSGANSALSILRAFDTPSAIFFHSSQCGILVVALSNFPALRSTTTNSCYKFSTLRKQKRLQFVPEGKGE